MIHYQYATSYIEKRLYLFAKPLHDINLVPRMAELAKKHNTHWVVILSKENSILQTSVREDALLQDAIADTIFSYLTWHKDAFVV